MEDDNRLLFAIIDDEEAFLLQFTPLIQKYGGGCQIHCDCFSNAKHFLEKCTLLQYDALFLDIDMPEIGGFELAEKLNAMGYSAPIVFITGCDYLITHAFRYRALGFVRKQAIDAELPYAMATILTEIQRNQDCITLKELLSEGGTAYTVSISTITYIESKDHETYVHLTTGKVIHSRSKLSDFCRDPRFESFILINVGTFVNLTHISLYRDRVSFEDGTTLFVSRRRANEVRAAYQRAVGRILL